MGKADLVTLRSLHRLASMSLDVTRAKLSKVAEQEAALRTQIDTLSTPETPICAMGGITSLSKSSALDQARKTGRENDLKSLNLKLASLLAEKDQVMMELKNNFGKADVLRQLSERVSRDARRQEQP